MKTAPLPPNEHDRLAALRKYQILDTSPEEQFNDLSYLASYICQTPIATVSIIDENRQWYKSKVGIDASETSRDLAFCSHAILRSEVMVVQDTLDDSRFADNPLVLGAPFIRFYAGAPLYTSDGFALGTICVIDRTPRNLSEDQRKALMALSRQASALMEQRRTLIELQEAASTIKILSGMLPICATCKSMRDEEGQWVTLEKYIEHRSEATFTHGICPDCAQRLYPNYFKK